MPFEAIPAEIHQELELAAKQSRHVHSHEAPLVRVQYQDARLDRWMKEPPRYVFCKT
jgi:hypothetical protein